MAVIGYLRVSTEGQELDNQRLAILDHAQRHGVTVDEFVELKMSSRRSTAERGIDDLFDRLDADDTLIVAELSRLGRSVGQIVRLVAELVEKRVRFVAVKEGIRLDGEQDLQAKVTITVFALLAELERDLISMRTKEGLAAAKARGKEPGRPRGSLGQSKLDGKEVEIQELLQKDIPKASIAKLLGVGRTTLTNFVKTRQLCEG